MDLFEPDGMFLIRFGFSCIFFGLFGIVEIHIGLFIKIYLILGFSQVFLRFFLGFLGTYKKFVIYS